MNLFETFIRIMLITLVLAAIGMSQLPVDMKNSKDFKPAASENAKLSQSLVWKWGKQQKGWYLYVHLIAKTLGTAPEYDSTEFASSVAVWQKKKGLRETGIVDEKTLFSFITYWQSRRISPVYEAREGDLLDAPIAEFYDQTRSTTLLKVDKVAHAAYKKMLEAARADLKTSNDEESEADDLFLKIISSYRSPEYQAELRRREPGATTAQIAVKSPHFTGRALDIYVGGEPVSTMDLNRAIQIETPAYLWLVENAESFGFYPYFYEPWHWEYVGR